MYCLSTKPLGNFLHRFLRATPSTMFYIYVRFLVRLDLENYKFSRRNRVTVFYEKEMIINNSLYIHKSHFFPFLFIFIFIIKIHLDFILYNCSPKDDLKIYNFKKANCGVFTNSFLTRKIRFKAKETSLFILQMNTFHGLAIFAYKVLKSEEHFLPSYSYEGTFSRNGMVNHVLSLAADRIKYANSLQTVTVSVRHSDGKWISSSSR